jgi:hypothetical protein
MKEVKEAKQEGDEQASARRPIAMTSTTRRSTSPQLSGS